MEGCSIRSFEDKDVDFAYRLESMEEWNYTRDDIKRVLGFEPNGCFIAEVGGEPVGHVFSVCYGRLGWIGFLIVKAEYRRRGIGTLLMKNAMGYLLSHEAKTIKLEAVPEMANLYRKLGFVDEFDSLRFTRIGEKITSVSNRLVRALKKKEITQLAEFDAGYFGANRIRVLSGIYEENPQLCFVSRDLSKFVGYIMCCEAESGYRICPWVCNPRNRQVVRELLIRCMKTIGWNERVYVGVPAVNRTAIKILRDFGFKLYSKSIRMYFGEKLETERVNGIFAIGGPEKG